MIENYPFLTVGKYLDREYIGIIGNSDNLITSIYLIEEVKDREMRDLYLEYGELWWNETNHQIPINIALGEKWNVFKTSMKSFITKDFEIISGPVTSLNEMIIKKPKRRQITLVRKG